MTSSTYTPREGSVAFRVLEFLSANPDESLSADEVAIKFDCTRNNVHTLLAPAVSAGSLIRRQDLEDGELVYRVGSGAPAVIVKPAAAPGSASNPFGAARGAARTPFWIDAGQIAIDSGVPLPPPRGAASTGPACSRVWRRAIRLRCPQAPSRQSPKPSPTIRRPPVASSPRAWSTAASVSGV